MKQGYRLILRQKEYCKLTFAEMINRFGDSIDAIALTWLIYAISQNPSLSVINFGLNYLPTIFLQPVAGALIENIPKKRILYLCDIGRGVIVSLIAFLYLTQKLRPEMLLIFTVLLSTFEAFRMPSGKAIVTCLVKKEDYSYALSFNQTLTRISEIIGNALASVIIGLFGVFIAIMVDAITFFLSALILMTLKVKEQNVQNNNRYLENLKAGFDYLKTSKSLQLICIMSCLLNALLVPLNSFQSVLAIEVYHMNAYVLSVLGVMMTIGMSLGSFIYPLIEKKSSVKFILLSCLMMQGLFYISLIMLKKLTSTIMIFYIVLSIISFVFGIFVAMGSSCVSVVTMKTIKKEYIARLMAIISAIATLCLPITSFILGIVSHYISISMIFIFFGMVCIILTLMLVKLNFKEYF